MNTSRFLKTGLIFSFALLLPIAAGASETSNVGIAPDNSAINKRDRDASEVTADQGSNQKSDREVMQDIRKALVADKSLSTYAHNAKIVAVNGKVTLKGVVRSQEESENLQDKAASVVGATNVTNELSVKDAK